MKADETKRFENLDNVSTEKRLLIFENGNESGWLANASISSNVS
jgi:hypothetical protein